MKEFLTWFDNSIMWGPAMIIFLLGSHAFLTIKTKFVQKHIFKGIKLSFKKEQSDNGNLSIFSSLMTALSSTIGTGNIIGVGTAIILGGPGSVLWTWIGGTLGIATKYAESYIAVKYRKKDENGNYIGGAMTVFEHLNKPLLAKVFAILCVFASFGIGCATQASAIADIVYGTFNIDTIIVGAVVCVLTALVIFGGIKSIGKACNFLVPIMSVFYIIGCVILLFMNAQYLPETISLILSSAFTTKAAAGGFIGTTIIVAAQNGIARGLFSNEAGMGSAPQATATSKAKNAVKPALVGATGVFWDTVVVCLLSGLVIVSSVIRNPEISTIGLTASELVSQCFGQLPLGRPILVFGIVTFAYSTILGWSYYGENCVRYLFGQKMVKIYQVTWIVVIMIGVILSESTVWTIADILNAAMVIPNMIAVLSLTKEIVKDTKYYLDENHLDQQDPELK